MDVHSLFNGKGGVGKSTMTPILASVLKVMFPDLTVGVISADSANGTLAKIYSKDLEDQDQGLWNVINTMISRRTQGREDLVEAAIHGAVRPLTIVPGACSVHGRDAEFLRAAKALGVDPKAPIEKRQIQFVGNAQFLANETSANGILNQVNSHEVVGVPLLQAFEKVLGWDICFIDFPGEIGDVLVRLLAPWCTCVVIPSDVVKPTNLTMERDVVRTLAEINVKPAGFLANKAAATAPSIRAIAELENIARDLNLEVLGVIRSLPTLALANSVYDESGREWIPQDKDWVHPEGGWHIGLYRAALDYKSNATIRGAAVAALKEVERVGMAIVKATPSLAARISVEV